MGNGYRAPQDDASDLNALAEIRMSNDERNPKLEIQICLVRSNLGVHGRRTNFFWHPLLPHKCGSEEFCRAPWVHSIAGARAGATGTIRERHVVHGGCPGLGLR